MLLQPDDTPERLGIDPGMCFELDGVPPAFTLFLPWQECVCLTLDVYQQVELACEGAVIVPVAHFGWPAEIRVSNPRLLLGTVRSDRIAGLVGMDTHRLLLTLV